MSSSDPANREQALKALLSKSLTDYEGGQAGFDRLVHDVESLIDSLEAVSDADWVKELRRQWAQLEIIYAITLDEGRPELSHKEKRDVDESVAALRATLKSGPSQK